jgi:K(+)-stimulated pyrophosphate-energized sodium pump
MGEAKIVLPALTGLQHAILWAVLGSAVLALLFGLWLVRTVLSADPGAKSMTDVADAVFEGSMAYLRRQIKTMLFFVVLIAIGLFLMYRSVYPGRLDLSIGIAVAFALGVGASYGAGFVGMWLAVKGNVRSANAARPASRMPWKSRSRPAAFRECSSSGWGCWEQPSSFSYSSRTR